MKAISDSMNAEHSMRTAMRNRDRRYFIAIKNRAGLAEKPSDLIKEQSELISKVGYSSSYMEAGQDRDTGDAAYLWWVVNKGVLNTRTPEGKLFKDNLQASLRDTAALIERRLRNQISEYERKQRLDEKRQEERMAGIDGIGSNKKKSRI